MTPRCGLIVNPVAGIGGEAALAGSDGTGIQELARSRGGQSRAADRAARALRAVSALLPDVEIVTGESTLGADVCVRVGVAHHAVLAGGDPTTAEDTRRLALHLRDEGVETLLFAGGDGTARDVCAAIGDDLAAIGIPAGVKMHSAVFAVTPEHVGPLAAALFDGRAGTDLAEVIDLDEGARRLGRLGSRLYGYLRVPRMPNAIQRGKVSSKEGNGTHLDGIAAEVAARLEPGVPCLLGPGTTVRDIAARFGVESTLLGIDMLESGVIMRPDLSAAELGRALTGRRFQVLVSPIGGQGVVLGRGNQQLDADVLSRLALEDLLIVCTPAKLAQFAGRSLLIDAPSEELNAKFHGLHRIIVGYRQEAVIRLE